MFEIIKYFIIFTTIFALFCYLIIYKNTINYGSLLAPPKIKGICNVGLIKDEKDNLCKINPLKTIDNVTINCTLTMECHKSTCDTSSKKCVPLRQGSVCEKGVGIINSCGENLNCL